MKSMSSKIKKTMGSTFLLLFNLMLEILVITRQVKQIKVIQIGRKPKCVLTGGIILYTRNTEHF